MAVNAVIGTNEAFKPDETIYSGHHGPVTRAKKVKTDQGVLAAGLIVAINTDGEIVPYNPRGEEPVNKPVGVLLERCDTTKEDTAIVIVHGTVWKNRIHVNGNPPSGTDLAALEAIGIWAMP